MGFTLPMSIPGWCPERQCLSPGRIFLIFLLACQPYWGCAWSQESHITCTPLGGQKV
jgi:hypothetical protein